MQVTHTEDHVTHVVIGGAKQIDMGISDSAEFFHILSSTLYSDQKLAVVRETVCNAWDAHIDANCRDKAIEITLTKEAITIRDFGKGIPKDLIGPIYGIYGASTKKNDGNATGGFGLGCKSPFSYTDNFQVTSFNGGIRTIYNMSKSSALVNGKPSIVPIASFPTTETGIEVVIRLTSGDHLRTFNELFQRIVYNGGIRATMNGEKMDTLKTYALKEKFFITTKTLLADHTNIAISYGNVIYPLNPHEFFNDQYSKANSHVDALNIRTSYRQHPPTLVLIAPPNSISVTPSRESLSMQSHTLENVKQLLIDFNIRAQKKYYELVVPVIKDSVKEAVKSKRYDELLTDHSNLAKPAALKSISDKFMVITNLGHLAKLHHTTHYPSDYAKMDFKLRVSELIRSKHTPLGLGQSFLSALRKAKDKDGESNWGYKHIVAPILKKMAAQPGMSPERLVIHNLEAHYGYKTEDTFRAMDLGKRPLRKQMPLLRNLIVITYSRKDVNDRLRHTKLLKETGTKGAMLMYVVPRSQAKLDEALAFFTGTGHRVINLTVPQEGERASVVAPIMTRAPVKKRVTGLVAMSCGIHTGSTVLDVDNYWQESSPRIKSPEFVALCTDNNDGRATRRFNGFSSESSMAIAELFGDRGGIVKTNAQLERYTEKGAKTLKDFLVPLICAYIQKCPQISAASAAKLTAHGSSYENKYALVVELNASPKALIELGLLSSAKDPLADKYHTIWQQISSKYYGHDDVVATEKILEGIKQSPDALLLSEGIKNSKMTKFINPYEIVSGLESKNPDTRTAAATLLQFICT